MSQPLQSLSSMAAEIGRIVQDTSTTRATVIKEAINRAYFLATVLREWPELVLTDESGLRDASDSNLKSLESGESNMPLMIGTGRLRSLHFQSQDGGIDILEPHDFFARAGSSLNTTGKPIYACYVGKTAQVRRWDGTGTVQVSSSSSANNNSKTVRVYFRASGDLLGNVAWQDVTGTFSSGVALTSTPSTGWPIEAITRPSGWTGTLVLAASGTTLAAVPPIALPSSSSQGLVQTISIPLLRVWPVPDADYALTVSWWKRPQPLVEDNDLPEIPVSPYLIEKAAAECLFQMGKTALAERHEGHAIALLQVIGNQGATQSIKVAAPAAGTFAQYGGYSGYGGYGWRSS